mgnify:CR=1 FL=1
MFNYRNLLCVSFLLLALTAWAQPNGTGNYYQDANGKKGKSLKTALFGIIKSPNVVSYKGLWDAYKKTDLRWQDLGHVFRHYQLRPRQRSCWQLLERRRHVQS